MGIIKSKFRKMEEFDCSMDAMDEKIEPMSSDPRSPTTTITRTPLNEVRGNKSSLINRAINLANISTPINNDLMLIQDKRFKHLAHSFIDPRSPSEGIVRTPIVLKSTDISSIVNTPRILEEELERDEEDEEDDFHRTFVERLSRMSFDDLEVDDQEQQQMEVKATRLPDLIETHFDTFPEGPVPNPLVMNLQSALDPRSPTVGIERTPLVLKNDEHQLRVAHKPSGGSTFAEQLLQGAEDEGEEEEARNEDKKGGEGGEERESETKANAIEGGVDVVAGEQKEQQQQIPSIVEPVAEEEEKPNQSQQSHNNIFVDVGRVIYGTPVQITATATQAPRTPLSCLANRKRGELNGKGAMTGKSPLTVNKNKQPQNKAQSNELKVKKSSSSTNPFENTTPRKLIR